jgi:hypothetical protein
MRGRSTPGVHEAQTIPGGMGPWPGCATQVRLAIVPPMPSIFVPD